MEQGRPNEKDLKRVREFAKSIINTDRYWR